MIILIFILIISVGIFFFIINLSSKTTMRPTTNQLTTTTLLTTTLPTTTQPIFRRLSSIGSTQPTNKPSIRKLFSIT